MGHPAYRNWRAVQVSKGIGLATCPLKPKQGLNGPPSRLALIASVLSDFSRIADFSEIVANQG
jgi:hypothetical protein